MASKIYIVKQIEKTWVVQREDAKAPSGKFDKKTDAVARGKELAEKVKGELHVMKADGTIQEKKSFLPAPKPTVEKKPAPAKKPEAAKKPAAKCGTKMAAKPAPKPAAKPAAKKAAPAKAAPKTKK